MSHYKPYPKYKPSGLDWLDRVPEHWEVMRLRHIANFKNSNVDKKSYEGQRSVQLCNYTDVYNNEHITATLPFMHATASDAEIEAFALKTGDILITKDSEDPWDIGIPAIVTDDMEGVICGYHLTMIRTHDPNISAFLHRSLQSHPTKAYFFVEAPGITRYGLSQDAIGDIKVCRPPENECVLIASWIGRETSRINALIYKKLRFIDLLKEKRQALITRAVTRGLDPAVKLVDSRSAELGPVPAHWTVPKLRHIATVQTGVAKGKDNKGRSVISVPYLRVANVQDGYLDLSSVSTIEISTDELKGYLLRPGDVLMNEGGDNDKLGRGHIWNGEIPNCVHQNHVFAVRPSGVTSEWLNLYTGSAPAQFFFTSRSKQTTNLASISSNNLLDLPVPRPPLDEQKEIIRKVRAAEGRLSALRAATERSVALLREHRAALITAAVTGQIDLRGAA